VSPAAPSSSSGYSGSETAGIAAGTAVVVGFAAAGLTFFLTRPQDNYADPNVKTPLM
jgi:hypothetical protein